jgi:hypothetical protein
MAIAPMSADQSAAAWAGAAAGAAEAYVDAQLNAEADAAAAAREAEEKWQQELAALAAALAATNDGVDPPPPSNPIGTSSVGGTGNSAGPSTATSSTNGGGSAVLVPDGNGNFTILPQVDNIVVHQQAPQVWDIHFPTGNGGPGSSSVQSPSNTPPPPDPPVPTNAPNQVNEPDPEKPKEAPKIVSGFGEQVDKLLNASPTLREYWQKMLDAGWEVKVVSSGKSMSVNKDKEIWINPADARNDPRLLAVLLSHEVGHAVNEAPYKLDAKEHTKADYVRKTVDARLEHEGDAAFENARIREEILAATGIDIGIAGRNADGPYLDIYEDFKNGMMSESEARRQMGELQGEELEYRPSTTKREAYTAEAMSDYEKERNAP